MPFRIVAKRTPQTRGATHGGGQRRRFVARALVVSAAGLLAGCSSTKSNVPAGNSPLASAKSTGSKVASALNPVTIGRSVGNSVKSGTSKMSHALAGNKTKSADKSNEWVRESKFTMWPFKKGPDPEFYVALARVQEQEGNAEGALQQYDKALDRDKTYAPALVGCAHLYDRQGQKVKATEYYLRAVRAHPKDAAIANDLGLCYARQGEFDEALKYIGKAVEMQPERDLYRNNIATVLVEVGRIDEAVGHIAKVYGEPQAHYNVGIMLYQHGQSHAAAEQFAIALRRDPGLAQAQQWLDDLNAEMAPRAQMASAEMAADPAPVSVADNPRSKQERIAVRPTTAYEAGAMPDTGYYSPSGPSTPLAPEEVHSVPARDVDPAALPTPTTSVKPLPPVSTGYVPPSRY